MNPTIHDLAWAAVAAATPVFLGLLTWVSAKLAALIDAHVKNKYVAGVLTRLDYAVINAVKTVEQTTLAGWRDRGALPADLAKTAKATAIQQAKTYLGQAGLRELLEVLGIKPFELDQLLGNRVEAAVLDLGQGGGAASLAELATSAASTVAATAVVAGGKP